MAETRSQSLQGGTGPIAAAVALAGLVSLFLLWLTYGRSAAEDGPGWAAGLPALAAAANGACAAALSFGWWAVRRRRLELHRAAMLVALLFSAVFFAAYVVHHYFHGDTPYPGQGPLRAVYFAVLISHVLGSMVVLVGLPLSLRFAVLDQRRSHARLGRWLLPLWLYVSVTGVLVFALLRSV